MSAEAVMNGRADTGSHAPPGLPFDPGRGTGAMWLFIATEAALFLILFFAYFFLGHNNARWPLDQPPKTTLALVMLLVLLSSSFVLHAGERAEKKGRAGAARLAVGLTLLLGIVFMGLQVLEYREHLKTLTPWSDAYGSIFYTITTLHGLHLALGMAMLAFVLVLPGLHSRTPPHRSLHNAALYWHFVDMVWVLIVLFLYLLPQVYRG